MGENFKVASIAVALVGGAVYAACESLGVTSLLIQQFRDMLCSLFRLVTH